MKWPLCDSMLPASRRAAPGGSHSNFTWWLAWLLLCAQIARPDPRRRDESLEDRGGDAHAAAVRLNDGSDGSSIHRLAHHHHGIPIQPEAGGGAAEEDRGAGIADFPEIVSSSIDEKLLRWKGIEATIMLAQSSGRKVVVIGNPEDGLPLILGG